MSQSDTNFSAKSSILQTSEIFTIVYTYAIDSVILDLQTKAVNMNKEMMIKNLVMSLKFGLITYNDFLRLYLQIESADE